MYGTQVSLKAQEKESEKKKHSLFIWNNTIKIKCQFNCLENEWNQIGTNVGIQQTEKHLYYYKHIYS